MGSAITRLGNPNDIYVPEESNVTTITGDANKEDNKDQKVKQDDESKEKNNHKKEKKGPKTVKFAENNNKSNIHRNIITGTENDNGGNEQRLVLIGSVGSGKSATGNSILNKYVFQSMFSPNLITKKNMVSTNKTFETTVVVVDTPGIHGSHLHDEDYQREVKESLDNAINLVQPGPHSFLLVVSIPRFSELDVQVVKFIEQYMKSIIKHIIIIFTGYDFLSEQNREVHDFKEELPVEFKDFIHYKCDNRVLLFTNTIKQSSADITKDHNDQVANLIQKVKVLTQTSGITRHQKLPSIRRKLSVIPIIQQEEDIFFTSQVPYLKTGVYKGKEKPIPGTEFLHAEYWKGKY